MKKIFNTRFIILISIFFAGLTAYVLSCADGSWGIFYMFNPEVTKSITYRPFYRSASEQLYNTWKPTTKNDCDSLNIAEWRQFFHNGISYEDLAFLLYQAQTADVQAIIQYRKSGVAIENDSLRLIASSFPADKEAVDEFLGYLLFAKKCEPVAVYGADIWNYYTDDDRAKANDPRKNQELTGGLVNEAFAARQHIKNKFIRQRYTFQIIRMYYYSKKFQECFDFYRQHADAMEKGITKYRAMSYAGGALYGLKRYAEANYIFSLIYDNCEPMRISAYYSFKPVEEADWQECLTLAKNTREKTVLWHLLGIYKDPLRAMREIYALDAKSDLLDVLVTRYVNLAEEQAWQENDDPSARRDSISYVPRANVIPDDAVQFISAVAKTGGTHRPQLWNLASSYILALKGRYDAALAIISDFEKSGEKDLDVCRQICSTRLLCILNSAPRINAEVEQKITADVLYLVQHEPENYNAGDPMSWVKSRLAERYRQQGDAVKAELLDTKGRYFYDNNAQMNKMIAFMDKPEKSELEKYYLLQYPMSRKSLYDFMAINAFYGGDLRKALALYKEGDGAEQYQIKKASLDGYFDSLKRVYNTPNIFAKTKLLGDPFIIHINDCHDCAHAAEIPDHYTKVEFVKALLTLKTMVDKDPKKHAPEALELANGFYNATFWGNARVFYVTDVTNNYTPYSYGDQSKQLKELPIYDCSRAAYYYTLAMDNSSNKEFKATCAFMLAKCEQNEFFRTKPENYPGDFKAGKYFRLLQKDYSETNYYKEIINECGYFRTFLNKK